MSQTPFLPHPLFTSRQVHGAVGTLSYRPHANAQQPPPPPPLLPTMVTELKRGAVWSCQNADCPLEGTVTRPLATYKPAALDL